MTLVLGGLVLFPTLNRVNQSQLDVLILFIDIPMQSIEQLIKDGEFFLV